MKVALLISTYNWEDALRLVLKSAKGQTRLPDEIVIADDGSGEQTKILIDSFRKEVSIPVKHVWHEDKGFRKSMILNKAMATMTSDYIIQTDGDCIMHKDFVKDHASCAEKNTYLFGSRINILPQYVSEIFEDNIIEFGFFSKRIKDRSRTLHIPYMMQRYKRTNHLSAKIRGCNLSYWRNDIIAINGYNEDFEGWGIEDSEVLTRLHNKGVFSKRIRYGGIIYHIHHESTPSKENNEIQEKNINLRTIATVNKLVRCENGIDKYL